MNRLRIAGIVLGVIAVLWGFNELRLSWLSRDNAVKITCKQLGATGPGDNAHVTLTDFLMTPHFVYEKGKTGSWTRVWAPAVAIDSDYAKKVVQASSKGGSADNIPMPKPVSVIITSGSVPNEKALDALGSKEELEGLVINSIETLSGEKKKLLEESYGDLSRAQIFDVGRKPSSMLASIGAMIGGVILAVGSLLSFFLFRKSEG